MEPAQPTSESEAIEQFHLAEVPLRRCRRDRSTAHQGLCGTTGRLACSYGAAVHLHLLQARPLLPPDRTVLADISLSFYPGAKIGVIGPNGSGKSSLLRIMAGEDDGYTGEARLTPGFTVGLLAQEPRLDPDKDVIGNVMDGVGPVRDVLARYDEVMAMWGDPDADYEKVGALQAELEDKIAAADAWNLDRNVEIAMERCAARRTMPTCHTLSGGERRRVALCPPAAVPPDLLLLDEPTNHLDAESVDWLERFLQEYHGTVVAITHDRYFLDNVARWILELDRGRGLLRRQLLVVAGAEAGTVGPGREAASAASGPWSGSSSGCAWRRRPARPGRPVCPRTRSCSRRPRPPTAGLTAADLHPAGAPPRRHGHRGRRAAQGLRRPAADRGSVVLAPRAGIVGVIGPNPGRARRRCSAC